MKIRYTIIVLLLMIVYVCICLYVGVNASEGQGKEVVDAISGLHREDADINIGIAIILCGITIIVLIGSIMTFYGNRY